MACVAPAIDLVPDFSGLVIDDRYQILEILGSGTYGVVFKAIDLQFDTDVHHIYRAIKIISKVGRNLKQLEDVRREVEFHKLVSDHPNVVTIHESFEDSDYFYIVLDLCRGGDLFTQNCNGIYVYNDELLRKAFLSLIDAVQTCHQARVFHRDLKPENILANSDGSEIYLSDFGLAIEHAVICEHGVGTLQYMSPECIGEITQRRPYNTRHSDVWALGVILIDMVGGYRLWDAAVSTDEKFMRLLEDPDYLKNKLPISDELNALFQRIFVLNSLKRITLHELRKAVVALDAFFVPREVVEDFTAVATAHISRRNTTTAKALYALVEYDNSDAGQDEYDIEYNDEYEDDDDTPIATRQCTNIITSASMHNGMANKAEIKSLVFDATDTTDQKGKDLGGAVWRGAYQQKVFSS